MKQIAIMCEHMDDYMIFTNDNPKGTHLFSRAVIVSTHASYEEAYEKGMAEKTSGFAIAFPKSFVGGHEVRRIEAIHLLDNGVGLYSELKQHGLYYYNPAEKFTTT